MIKLAVYGKDVLMKIFVLVLILLVISLFINMTSLKIILLVLAVFILAFTLFFFRDPDRKLPPALKKNQIISPADGKIVLIEDVINKGKNIFDVGEELKQVSIFLSPLDVHVNRIPMTGVVNFFKYISGGYVVAFDHKSSEKNERTEIGIINQDSQDRILFKQIAGFVARRIVCEVKEKSKVVVGERFGMIKFGSRIDMLVKRDSKILVNLNQKVICGETIIAEL